MICSINYKTDTGDQMSSAFFHHQKKPDENINLNNAVSQKIFLG